MESTAGGGRIEPAAPLRPKKGRRPPSVRKGRALYRVQARLRLSRHAHPLRRDDHRGKLAAVEAAESALFAIGFRDFRVRTPGGAALVQVTADQTAAAHEKWDAIRGALAPYFTRVELDAKERNKSL